MSASTKRAKTIRQCESRLRRIFRGALIAAVGAPALAIGSQACSSDGTPGSVVDASVDAARDSQVGTNDGATDAEIVDAGPCAPYVVQVDAQAPDGGIECGIFQRFACGIPAGQTLYSDCYFLLDNCAALCPGSLYFNCHIYGDKCDAGVILGDGSDLLVECATCPNGVGRRPPGLLAARPATTTCENPVGDYFAEAAHLEAASVHAFRILRAELVFHGAPAPLIAAAIRAERDEIRHARVTGKIARAYRGAPRRARVKRRGVRALDAIAIENAVEGCVRETFGALVATWQASRAEDPVIARAMKRIAIDETRHAALAWSVSAWAMAKLDADVRTRVAEAFAKAFSELENDISAPPHSDLVKKAGLPPAVTQRRLLRELRRSCARLPVFSES